MAYRNTAGIRGIFTNNGVESLNNVLKNKVMGGSGSKKSIPQLVIALVMDYVPVRQRNYRHKVYRSLKISYFTIVYIIRHGALM